jgi:hypothetical protein
MCVTRFLRAEWFRSMPFKQVLQQVDTAPNYPMALVPSWFTETI